MSERSPKLTNAPLITRPGESKEHLGTRNIVKFLPEIFQTQVNRQFLDSTMEQLLSSGSLQPIKNYVGQQFLKDTNADNYLIDDRTNDTHQFAPALINKDDSKNIQGTLPYDDLINALKFSEVDVNNHNKTLNETAYTLDLPINYDMFINYHKYFWLVDILPPCDIVPVISNRIDIDTIVGKPSYTTPTLKNNKTLALQNGMRIRFKEELFEEFTQTVNGNTTFTSTFNPANASNTTVKVFKNNIRQTITSDYTHNTGTGVITFATAPAVNDVIRITSFYAYSTSGAYEVDSIYIVDGVGTSIKLTKQFEATKYNHYARDFIQTSVYEAQNRKDFFEQPTTFGVGSFEYWDSDKHKNTKRDYVVEERWATDKSAWARSNLWIHEDSALAMLDFQELYQGNYLVDTFRGVRPIIEFKANLSKYNFGKNHLTYVDHLVEDNINPATVIVGQANWSWTILGITDSWANQGYEKGSLVYVTAGTNTSYWECIQTHTDSRKPTFDGNRIYWREIKQQPLENNDLIMFLQTTNATYTNKIFRVSGVGSSIALTEVYGSSSTAINTNDKVVVINGHNTYEFGTTGEFSEPYSGSEWYWNGSIWAYGQQKTKRSGGMLVNFYDIDGVALDNTTTYPNSTFKGGEIFNYVGNTSNTVDSALGFAVDYADYGNAPGINFQMDLINKKYSYTESSPNTDKNQTKEITGYYYYKNLSGTAFNGWNNIRGSQPVKRVIRKIITKENASSALTFDLGYSSFTTDRYYTFTKTYTNKLKVSSQRTSSLENRINKINGTLPTLFFNTGTTYTIQTQFAQGAIEFVNLDNSAVGSGITRTGGTGDVFTLVIGTPTVDIIKYRISGTTNEGLIYFNTITTDDNIKLFANRTQQTNYTISGNILTVNGSLAIGDIYELEYFTDNDYSLTAEGVQLPSDTQTYNAQNLNFGKVSFGDLIEHMRQQMTGIPGFTGTYFGTNNYNKLPHVHEFGGTIRHQPYSTELLNQLLMDNDTNPYGALKYSAAQYSIFLKQFKLKVAQLHKTLSIEQPVYTLVDKALEALFVGKNKNTAFAYSDMAMYRDYESLDFGYTSSTTPVFEIPRSVNTYDDTKNHVQVWIQDDDGSGNLRYRSLIKDIDYTIGSNKVTIIVAPTFPSGGQVRVHIRWYKRDSVSFVPPSAVKLGLCNSYIPELRSDYSKDSTGTAADNVIIGHDGSVHIRNSTELYNRNIATFDPVDAAIWDLECRIYNNLRHDRMTEIDNISVHTPNGNRANVYTWSKFQNNIKSEFNKWKTTNNKTELSSNTYYDASDKFTWNYNSVTPNIGGWRGLYYYFFNTDRPHTHPWEMLGHNRKPSWWDANYSWTNAPKRTALISALKYGKVTDPSLNDIFDINYSYNNYDWATKILVTTGAVLNDPVTAGVVSSPSDPAKEFVFGDWGPVEAEWRRSPEYKIQNFTCLLKARPLVATNNYFDANERKTVELATFSNEQIYNANSRQLVSWNKHLLSTNTQSGKIIESVRIINAGSGYGSAPTVSIFDNFGSNAQIEVFITGGLITSAGVLKPGKNFYNKPKLTLSGTGKLEAVLADNAQRYFIGLQNSIVDFSKNNGTLITDVQDRFNNMIFQPVIKAGGFINNNQKFILESSQDKGKVFVPEENFQTLLYTNNPSTEYFYGAVKVDKVSSGYSISGFDNSKLTFTYTKPMTNSNKISVVVGSTEVFRYNEFENITSTLDYNTVLPSIQAVYEFILGYGNYLNTLGFTQPWISSANTFVTWAGSTNTTTIKVIPDDSKITIQDNTDGYFDSIENRYDGIYNVNDSNGNQVLSTQLIIDRNISDLEKETVFSVKDSSVDEIYGLRLYKTKVEHAIIFDNITNFDDVIYHPAIGQRHVRIVWQGSRTKNWNGRFFSPGYIISDNTILPNFDTVAKEVDQYYGTTNTLSNKQISNVARFNSSYNKPNWSENLDIDDDTLFNFVQGTRKYSGTKYAVDAFARNKQLFDSNATIDLHEEWAIRTNDFGDTRPRDTLEFEITPNLLTTSPQPIRFTAGEKNDVLTDLTIDVDSNSPLLVTGTPGNNFTTRSVRTYTETSITEEAEFENDFINSGLPLTTETDYRVINREDMTQFPEKSKTVYDFSGDWQDVLPWKSTVSYKFNEKVMHQGRSWAMLDPDGSSGLTTGSEPIEAVGTITLPIIPSSGGTLILDSNTISLSKTQTTTSLSIIQKIGTQDIVTSNVVTHGSTLILGQTSGLASTITFNNPTSTTTYNNIVKTGIVSNPSFVGSATKTLIIDGTTVSFNDTVSSTTNITAQAALENSFNANGFSNVSTLAVNRINAIESLRLAYVSANSSSAWTTFMTTYFTNNAGINLSQLLTEYGTSPSYTTQLASLITSDVALINEQTGNSYVASAVISGSTVIPSSDITATQNAVDDGVHIADFATYIKSNPTVVLATTTVVTTSSGSVFKTYNLSDIVQEINDAGIANITASASTNYLRIAKTTSTPTVAFSMTISLGTVNADVGFNTSTETINATSSTSTTFPALTITQVVDQINNANISGISAAINASNTNLLQINCNLDQLYIGNGSANSVIGLTSGVTPASSTTATSATSLDVNDVVDKVNAAGISGVSASNSNNRLKIISVNSSLVIGAGTANSVVGLVAQTLNAVQTTVSNVFNAIVGSDGNQVFREMTNDPNIFSIHVADDSVFGNYNIGYQVYQTMDLSTYAYNICAGVVSADEAEVVVKRYPSNLTQAHNLSVGDYVLIRGSTCVPSVDGIHKVSKIDANNTAKFFIDEYIQEEGKGGNIYPLRPVRFNTYNELNSAKNVQVNGVYKFNFSGLRQNNSATPIYAYVDNDGTGSSAVYKWSGSWTNANGHHNGVFEKVRTGNGQARNDLIENVKIYDAVNRSSIANIETWDPAKGIIFGFIAKEIDYKLTNDIASYNYSTQDGEIENVNAWKDQYVGTRWWDLSSAIYLDYEQSTIDYQQANWGRLADGADIEIYEWTRSPVLPEQWQSAVDEERYIDGKVATGEAYFTVVNGQPVYNWTEQDYYNVSTRRNETVYYFWVKNKQNYAGVRNYNVSQLSQILKDPTAFGLSWAAASGASQLLLSNIDQYVTNNTVVQINQLYPNSNSLPLNEWTLLAENDPNTTVPEYLHIKMRDSLAGFNNFAIDTTFTTYSSATSYDADAVVKEGDYYYISLQASNQNNQPSTDSDQSHWSRIYDYSIIDGTQIDDIRIWRGQMLPDLDLHKYNRYGHLIRPRQSLFRDLVQARQNFVYTANKLLSEINVIDEISDWKNTFEHEFVRGNVSYSIKDYINLVDWKLVEKNNKGEVTFEFNENTVADVVYNSDQDYIDAGAPAENSYVLVKNDLGSDLINRSIMYYYSGGTSKIVWKEKATIELSEEMWLQSKFGHGFDSLGFDLMPFDSDSSIVIGKLMDLLRSKIFVGKHHVMYNKLWFKLLYSAILQNTTDDFAFKTTYVRLRVNHPLLTKASTYQRYNVKVIEDYFNTIKPFHTKLLDILDSNTYGEANNIEVDEQSRNTFITMKHNDHTTRDWNCDMVLLGGDFSTASTINYTVTFQPVGTPSANKYFIDGVQQQTLELIEGNTYIFDWSASSAHPLRFATTSDGTHLGGTEYTTGVTVDTVNYKTTIVVGSSAPTLYYYCQIHTYMGGQANVSEGGVPLDEDGMTFTTLDADIDDIYNGNIFDQPACEGWGEELYPNDFTENIAISVQTNASGSTVTSDTRTFRMSIYQPNDIHFSNVIVDAQKTTTTASVAGLDTTIPVTDATVLDNPNTVFGVGEVPGVVYINGERIEYNAVSGNNLLYCTRGTLGTSAKAHDSGATVVNSGPTTRIPILDKFSHYGDNLRMAYNDSGTSLSAAGNSPEHAFIRNAGQGSI